MSAKDRLKQAFEFSLVASYTRHLIAERPWSSGRKVLEERHGTLRTSFSGALALSSAVPGSLDLGTPPIGPLIRRAAVAGVRTDNEIPSWKFSLGNCILSVLDNWYRIKIALSGVILQKRRALMAFGREDKIMKIEIEYCGQ